MTPPASTRETSAGRTYHDLRNLAQRHGRDTGEYLMLYALEGFLARLTASGMAADFVLKGGVLMAAFAPRRPTRDIDLAAFRFPNNIDDVLQRVQAIAARDAGDGLVFAAESVSGAAIRDEADYPGVRVTLTARLASARIVLHIDVNFGDPIWPGPAEVEVPRLLGGTVRAHGYPIHMVLAEKLVTAVDRGVANTRWRDFVDIAAISDGHNVRQTDLASAIAAVAAHRKVTVRPPGEVLAGMADLAQSKWVTWRRKQRLEATTPEQFQDLLDRCAAFADPVLDGRAVELTWSSELHSWVDAGGIS